jgi:hypothetical protein
MDESRVDTLIISAEELTRLPVGTIVRPVISPQDRWDAVALKTRSGLWSITGRSQTNASKDLMYYTRTWRVVAFLT